MKHVSSFIYRTFYIWWELSKPYKDRKEIDLILLMTSVQLLIVSLFGADNLYDSYHINSPHFFFSSIRKSFLQIEKKEKKYYTFMEGNQKINFWEDWGMKDSSKILP